MVLVKRIKLIWKIADNRRFPSSPGICIKTNEVQCTAFDMEMIFSFSCKSNSFSMCTWPHFEREEFWNSEVTYYPCMSLCKGKLNSVTEIER